MTDTTLVVAPTPGPIQRASMDMLRSVLMSLGTSGGLAAVFTGQQWGVVVGAIVTVISALWSYAAAHPSKTNPLQTVLGIVRKGGQTQAWNVDVGALEAALLPAIERVVDAQIKARAAILSGPLDAAANAALKSGGNQVAEHLRIT